MICQASNLFRCVFLLVILTLLTQLLQGSLILLQRPFCFAGYLAVGPQPVLYALYVSIFSSEFAGVSSLAAVFSQPPRGCRWFMFVGIVY
jgi:hypothetical protein